MQSISLSLVVPAYNEADRLSDVVSALTEELRRAALIYELILVDNGSHDSTGAIARTLASQNPNIRVVTIEHNEGYGAGVLAGLAKAKGDIVGWMHADGQVKPADVVRLYRRMESGEYAMAKAVRIERDESRWRRLQSRAYNWLFRVLFGIPYRDINGTPKLLKREACEESRLVSKDWFLDPESVIKIVRRKLPLAEEEIHWNHRAGGASKVHLFTSLEFLRNMVLYRLYLK